MRSDMPSSWRLGESVNASSVYWPTVMTALSGSSGSTASMCLFRLTRSFKSASLRLTVDTTPRVI